MKQNENNNLLYFSEKRNNCRPRKSLEKIETSAAKQGADGSSGAVLVIFQLSSVLLVLGELFLLKSSFVHLMFSKFCGRYASLILPK